MLSILVIYGSHWFGRIGIRLADCLVRELRVRRDDVELIDIKEVGLSPLDRTHKEYGPGAAPDAMRQLADKIRSADTFVFVLVTGEFNLGIQAGLKYLTNHAVEQWFWRPAAIASYSADRLGGARSNMAWPSILSEMGMIVVWSSPAVGELGQAFDEYGHPQGEGGAALAHNFRRFADDCLVD